MAALVLTLASAALAAIQLDQYTATVHEFTLANGLKVVLLEDHGSPVVSACFTVRGGYADDPKGLRGLASMAPLLLQEGPEQLGSRNLTEERAAIKRMNASFAEQQRLATQPGSSALYDRMRVEGLTKVAIRDADNLAKAQFSRLAMEQYGALGFRSSHLADQIQWSATLPSNRIDALLLLYGEWLRLPFPRHVFGIKELRQKDFAEAESSQDFALRKVLLPLAFGESGYGVPEIVPAELDRIGYSDVEAYLKSRFVASNLVLTLAGDLTLSSARELTEKYLSKVPAGAPYRFEPAAPVETKAVRGAPPKAMQSAMAVAYRRPPEDSSDDPVFDFIEQMMIEGPDSRFRKEFLASNPLLGTAYPMASLPGTRRGGLMVLLVPYHPSKTPREWIDLICAFLEEPGKTPPPAGAVDATRRTLEDRMLSVLSDPAQAVQYIGRMGGWKPVLQLAQAWANVSPADVQRVAAKYMTPETRVILEPGYVPPAPAPEQGVSK